MYASHTTFKICAAVLVALSFCIAFRFVFADTATSSSYMTQNTVSNEFGGSATSASFSSVQTGGEAATGESTSTDFLVDAGSLYFDTFSPASEDWEWFDDPSDETPTSSMATVNVAPTGVGNLTTIKLRMTLKETAGVGSNDVKFALQYSTSSDFSSAVYSVVEQGTCDGSSSWCYADGAGVDNSKITTHVLPDSDPCSGSVGAGCGTHNESGSSTSSASQAKNAATEYEFTIQDSGAVSNTVYFFRAISNLSGTPVPLLATSSYPSLTTEGATLTFTIGGISTSTPAAGVTTSFTTTSTLIPFGMLTVNTPIAGAQQLTVTTNAAEGYEIYAYQQQGLTNGGASQLAPISGTNASPVGWSTGCASTSTSCYGYHTSESVLSGGSTRFAPIDSYASFSSSPDEIAYSSGPATNRTTDMVYKVEAQASQPAGSYEGGIVYIVGPTF
jgi:hypothetical protein